MMAIYEPQVKGLRPQRTEALGKGRNQGLVILSTTWLVLVFSCLTSIRVP